MDSEDEADKVLENMTTFHVACFLAGENLSPVHPGLVVDAEEERRRSFSGVRVRQRLGNTLKVMEGTFSYAERVMNNEYTEQDIKRYVKAMSEGEKVRLWPTGGQKEGLPDLGAIYGFVIFCMLPFEVLHPRTN